MLDACRELGVAFWPVAGRLLAGSVKDGQFVQGDIRAGMPRLQELNLSHNQQLARRLARFGAGAGVNPGQISFAWASVFGS